MLRLCKLLMLIVDDPSLVLDYINGKTCRIDAASFCLPRLKMTPKERNQVIDIMASRMRQLIRFEHLSKEELRKIAAKDVDKAVSEDLIEDQYGSCTPIKNPSKG